MFQRTYWNTLKLVAISIKISYKTALVYYRNDQFVIEHSVSKNYSKTFSNISVSIQQISIICPIPCFSTGDIFSFSIYLINPCYLSKTLSLLNNPVPDKCLNDGNKNDFSLIQHTVLCTAPVSNNCVLKWLPNHGVGIFRFYHIKEKSKNQVLQSLMLRDRFE